MTSAPFGHDYHLALNFKMIKYTFFVLQASITIFTRIFQNVFNKHAPLKQRKLRGYHAPFMSKDLSKEI